MAKEPINSTDWNAVAAKALAFQALHVAGLADKSVLEKAKFLMGLGVNRADTAALIGSSDDSLRVNLARQAKKEGSTPKAAAEA